VASLAAPWAALQWPGADIRCVTFGNPKPGNQAYSDVSRHLVSPLLPLGFTALTTQAVSCLLASYLDSVTHPLACLMYPTLLPIVIAFPKQIFLSPLETSK